MRNAFACPIRFAEALSAAGRIAEATRAIGVARANLLKRAEKIADPVWRARFLKGVPEHSRTLFFRAGLPDSTPDSTEESQDTLVDPPRPT